MSPISLDDRVAWSQFEHVRIVCIVTGVLRRFSSAKAAPQGNRRLPIAARHVTPCHPMQVHDETGRHFNDQRISYVALGSIGPPGTKRSPRPEEPRKRNCCES